MNGFLEAALSIIETNEGVRSLGVEYTHSKFECSFVLGSKSIHSSNLQCTQLLHIQLGLLLINEIL